MQTRQQRRAEARSKRQEWRTCDLNQAGASNRAHAEARIRRERLRLIMSAAEGNRTRYFSNAQWPVGTYPHQNDLTDDSHATHEQAQGVCDLLLSDKGDSARGYNSKRPVKTWVTVGASAAEGGKAS